MEAREKKLLYACQRAEKIIRRKGIEEFEIFGISSVSNEIEIYRGEVEKLLFADTAGIGIRIYDDYRIGYAYTSILDEDSIKDCIDSAFKNSILTNKEAINYLPSEKDFRFKSYDFDYDDIYSPEYFDFTLDKKINLAKDLEKLALSKDKHVKEINNLIYEDGINEVMIMNSGGFKGSYSNTESFAYLSVISEKDGDTSTGDYFNYVKSPSEIDIEEISDEAVRRSVSILSAKKIKSIVSGVILDPLVAARLLGVLAGTFSAEAVQKGKSLFAGKIGKKILSSDIDLIDDGKLNKGMASRPFDAEGVPKGRTVVVENGILKSYLYNTYTARKDNKLSTGNSTRSSYKTTPSVGVSNFYLSSMDDKRCSRQELFKVLDKGFYVTDIIGVHSGINPISGDISVGAKGLWVEKGEISYPVKEVTIATDILSLCSNIVKIGDDIKFMPSGGYVGSPSLLVKDISIGGH